MYGVSLKLGRVRLVVIKSQKHTSLQHYSHKRFIAQAVDEEKTLEV